VDRRNRYKVQYPLLRNGDGPLLARSATVALRVRANENYRHRTACGERLLLGNRISNLDNSIAVETTAQVERILTPLLDSMTFLVRDFLRYFSVVAPNAS
jgi:hypothetical protein